MLMAGREFMAKHERVMFELPPNVMLVSDLTITLLSRICMVGLTVRT